MKTIMKDGRTPFEISASNDHSIMTIIESIRVTVPVYSGAYSKPEYIQFNLLKMLNAFKRGKLKIIQNK